MSRETDFVDKGDTQPIPYLENPEEPFQEKPHFSEWFITLNSNKSASADHSAEEIKADLVAVLRNTFSRQNLPRFLFINNSGYELTATDLDDRTLFPNFPGKSYNSTVRYVSETGSKKNRVHLHAVFSIIHYTYLQINAGELHEVMDEEVDTLGGNRAFDSVYLNIKWKPSSLPLKNYMRKSVQPEKLTKARVNNLNEDIEADLNSVKQQLEDFKLG